VTEQETTGQEKEVAQASASDGREQPEMQPTLSGLDQAEVQPAPPVLDQTAALQAELDKAKAQAAEYLDGWQRARAELSNAKKRMDRELAEARENANARLIARLLPVLDDFDRAVQTLPPHLLDLTWVEGILLIQRKLNLILEAEGVKPIEAEGKPFDPIYHEAIGEEAGSDHPEGTVAAVVQKGYMLGERVLRPALVRVAK